jgi:GNAT superfamily N-acetyltransferase
MPLPDNLHMRVADEPDLPAIATLRESVEWVALDWALRAVLEPPDARCLVVVDADDAIVGVGSGISYGPFGFVGNMIVAEHHRRRGVGAAILEAILAFLEDRGCTRLELFATDSGRPLYARNGFVLTGRSTSALLPRSTPLEADPSVEIAEGDDIDELSRYDAPRFGGDRRPLLAMMTADPARPLLVARRDGRMVAYAWLRLDGPRIGPFLADTPEDAASLLAEAFHRFPQVEALGMHLPSANAAGIRWLEGTGVDLDQWDGRMARGPQIPRRDETIYANLVGALG